LRQQTELNFDTRAGLGIFPLKRTGKIDVQSTKDTKRSAGKATAKGIFEAPNASVSSTFKPKNLPSGSF
jgi:hypothetical protein